MTVDERVRSGLQAAASVLPPATSSDPAQIIRRGRQRRRARRTRWSILSVVLLVGVLALIPFDPNAFDPADTHDASSVEIADLAVAVVDPEPVTTDPDVWLGLPGPAPRFDTSELGPNLSFTPGSPSLDDLDDRIRRAVYLGELDGEPFYIYSTDAPSIWDRLFEIIGGNPSGDVLGTSLNCCMGGDMDHEGGHPGLTYMQNLAPQETEVSELIVAEWIGLSPDVSVVAYQLDGVFVGWQTPVGGVSSIEPDHWPERYILIAFDANGQELDRSGYVFPPDDPTGAPASSIAVEEDSATEWAPLDSTGIEIAPEDLPTTDLRDVMAPQAGDRIFAVTTNGYQVFVLISVSGQTHTFATSCDVLAAVDLPPGWDGTCLERTVNGQRETGVFDYQEVTSQDS